MNIVEFHYKIAFYLDAEKSPRFKAKSLDKAINSAINDIVLDRYDNIRQKQKEYAFQTSQRLRDELYTIVYDEAGLTPVANVFALSDVTNYWLLLSLEVDVSGKTINTIPLTYDELNIIEIDPYVRPSIVYPERVYRIESNDGVKVVFGDVGSLVSGHIYYIKKPVKVKIGTQISSTSTMIPAGKTMIAYVDSTYSTYDKDTGNLLSSGNELLEEEEFLVPVNQHVKLQTGVVYIDSTETDLPTILHEEIARKAAAILSGNVENYNKEKSLETDIKSTEN